MGKVGYVLTFPCTCEVTLFSPGYCPPIKCLDVLWIDVEGFGRVALSQRPPEEIDQHNFWEMCSLHRPHLCSFKYACDLFKRQLQLEGSTSMAVVYSETAPV